MKIAIIGHGFVGKAMLRLFPEALVYDPLFFEYNGALKPARIPVGTAEAILGKGFDKFEARENDDERLKEAINKCEVVFVCVPTDMMDDGQCDTSVVEKTIEWLNAPLIIIRSTIKPGTTDRLKKETGKNIVFQPEYVGETTAHPLLNESERTFLIFGGDRKDCAKAAEVYQQVYNASVKIMFLSAIEAEIVKYMENTAIGTIVTLCNEFYNICEAFGVDYHMVREGFLMDPRMSRYFTFVYPEARGFSGKCLPKDLNAIAYASKEAGYQASLIESILNINKKFNNPTL